MKRLDIVLSQAVEEDFFKMCRKQNIAKAYSKYSNVCGEGFQVPKLGDSIWPQLNTSIMVVCDNTEAQAIKDVISRLRLTYPDDGIFCCISEVEVF